MPANALKVFIVDDEFQSRNLLSKLLLENFPQIVIAGQAATVEEAIAGIKELSPDLILLDIEMQGETGFDLLQKLDRRDFQIIFVTAHNEYALKAFRFSAVDYLLKPIMLAELEEAIDKAVKRLPEKKFTSEEQLQNLVLSIQNPKKIHDKIAVPTLNGFLLVLLHDILFCHATGNYTEFHLVNNKQLLSSYTLKQYHDLLVEHSFFRAHRSYLINLAHVKMYRRGNGGIIVMQDDSEIELSRQHKEAFLQFFKA